MGKIKITDKKQERKIETKDAWKFYQVTVLHMVSFSATIEKVLYMLDSELHDRGDTRTKRELFVMLREFEKYKKCYYRLFCGNEEFVLDMFYKIQKSIDKRLQSHLNVTTKKISDMDNMKEPRAIAYLSLLLSLSYAADQHFIQRMNMLGYGASYPDCIPKAFEKYSLVVDRAIKLCAHLDKQKRPQAYACTTVLEQYEKLLTAIVDNDTLSKAVDYAHLQNS